MTRLPLIDPDTVTGEAGEFLRSMPVMLNLFRTLAHAEGCLGPQLRLGGALRSKQILGERDRELLILLVARLQNASYEWTHHTPIALELGISSEAIAAISELDLVTPFTARDQALLAFGRQVVESADADDAVLAALRVHLSDREVVEAILAVGYYMTMARVLNVSRTQIDDDLTGGLQIFRLARGARPEGAASG